MSHDPIQRRLWVTVSLLGVAFLLLQGLSHGERRAPRHPLRDLPMVLGDWQGLERPLEERIVEAVGVDDYVNRLYRDSGGFPLALYIGYYESQRTGDIIHSPKNCLPGAGWQPVQAGRISIPLSGHQAIEVNQYVVQKGLDRQLVFYWYHGRGRVVASEYWGKVWMVVDAIRRNRTDGALVRISAPIRAGREEETRALAQQFVRELYPHLADFIPG
jgi:EpsI family protein